MRKYIIIVVIGIFFLLSGCSLSHYYGGKGPIEIEQIENPMIWREVYQILVTQGSLKEKVNEIKKELNELRDEVATTKLSSIQANNDMESLRGEIQQIKSESVRKEKPSVDMIRPVPEMQPEGFKSIEEYIKNKKEMLKMGRTKVAGESQKAGPDIQSITINDIKYRKVSDTQDQVLIFVNGMNNPKVQMLRGESPRIVLDFLNTRNIVKEKYEINTDGNLIKRIRIRSYKEPMQKVRVVFDMVSKKKYSVEKKFSKKENIYSFDIKGN